MTQAPHTRQQFLSFLVGHSFPLDVITITTLLMHEITDISGFAVLGSVQLRLLTLAVIFPLYRTLKAIGGHKICQPD